MGNSSSSENQHLTEKAEGEWQNGLFGCFDNIYICCLTAWLPCLAVGKTAANLGDSYCCHAVMFFIPILNFICILDQRKTIKQRKGIEEGCCMGIVKILFCPFCVVAQHASESETLHHHDHEPEAMARN